MSHRLYTETRSILDEDNPNARWENNQDGFPAPDLGLGPDGKERDKFTERDVEILASNPITLVAMDAAVKDIISLHQAMHVGYKPLPRLPQGLTQLALNGAFLEIGKRILNGKITVPEESKRNTHGYTYLSMPPCCMTGSALRRTGRSTSLRNDGRIFIAKPSAQTLYPPAIPVCWQR